MDSEVQFIESTNHKCDLDSSHSEKIANKMKENVASSADDSSSSLSDYIRANSQTYGDDEPRGSAQSHSTSMSSLSVSIGGLPRPITASPFVPDFPKHYSPKANKENNKEETHTEIVSTGGLPKIIEHPALPKTLSFRTDSTGSMGSVVSSLDLSSDGHERYDTGSATPDSSTSTPLKNHNTSSVSLLVSALKHNHKMKKKSVSFSLPSEDDIARRAKRKNSAMLYAMENFDDAIPDYQITSPKVGGGSDSSARKFASPDRVARRSSDPAATRRNNSPSVGIAALRLSEESMKDQSTNNLSGGLGITGSPDARRKVIVVPNSDGDERDSGDQHHTLFGNGTPTSITHSLSVGNPIGASSVLTGTMTVIAQERSSQECAEPSLMQRVKEAKSTQELCEVFGITTESVFTGETLKKQFSRDLIAKDRLVWIVPRSKSIHWAKNANDRLDAHKVKYFLLDKNSPHTNSALILSTSTSPKEENYENNNADAADIGIEEVDEASFGATSAAISSDCVSNLNSSPESTSPILSPAVSPTASGISAACAAACAAAPAAGPAHTKRDRTAPWTERAQGEMLGIIHSAVIHHLTIKIKTESGDYLNLKVNSSKRDAIQRAKDWFTVIKTLTKDI